MKKESKSPATDDLRAEYDFSSMAGGVRGKYAAALRRGSSVVLLEPDVAAAFPSADAVNTALRAVIQASQVMRRVRRQPREKVPRAVRAPHR